MASWQFFFFFMQKTPYELRISDWSSDVCSSDLGGLHVDRVFLLEGAGLVAAEEAEAANLARQVGQRELHRPGLAVEVVEAEPGEVADQHVARQLRVGEAGEVVGGLP